MKESYESMKLLLGKIKFDEFKSKLCGDLKIVALLVGIQLVYTKYCCFLFAWDSRDENNHYSNKLWPKQTSVDARGEKCRQSSSCSSGENLSVPFAHPGLMKNFVTGMDKTGCGFQYVRNKFPNVSDAIIKEVIFIRPQIREFMQDKQVDEDLNEAERNAWLSFKRICKDFVGNHKVTNYQDFVQDQLTSY
jgi:hypothetical protein